MNEVPQISNLAKVIEAHLNGQKLVSYSSRYLTKPGDNYGSIMLSLSANIQNPDGTMEKLPLVVKLPPLTNNELWDLFEPETSCLRENAIYCDLSPSVRQLQLDSGIPEDQVVDLFAKFYGCRISLDEEATKLDRDAVLVLEDLQCSGYKPGIRRNKFDMDHTKLVLKYVARYHAYPIALRNKQPKRFEEDILPKFPPYGFVKDVELAIRSIRKDVDLALGEDKQAIDRYDEMDKLLHENISNIANQRETNNLFATVAHFDLWSNNIMIHYDASGAPSKLKIVDFQTTQYASLAHDVVFLLLTSVENDILEAHFDGLLQCYYNEFIGCLRAMLCDVKEYSYQKFSQELKNVASIAIPHAIFMSKIIMTDDTNLSEELDLKAMHLPASPAALAKIRDIVRLSQKFGLF